MNECFGLCEQFSIKLFTICRRHTNNPQGPRCTAPCIGLPTSRVNLLNMSCMCNLVITIWNVFFFSFFLVCFPSRSKNYFSRAIKYSPFDIILRKLELCNLDQCKRVSGTLTALRKNSVANITSNFTLGEHTSFFQHFVLEVIIQFTNCKLLLLIHFTISLLNKKKSSFP